MSIEILKIYQNKSTTGVSIKLLKENIDICAPTLTKILHSCIADRILQHELKLADITHIFKSIDSAVKKNYRPISLLNSVSKLFEKLIQRQLNQLTSMWLSERLHNSICFTEIN